MLFTFKNISNHLITVLLLIFHCNFFNASNFSSNPPFRILKRESLESRTPSIQATSTGNKTKHFASQSSLSSAVTSFRSRLEDLSLNSSSKKSNFNQYEKTNSSPPIPLFRSPFDQVYNEYEQGVETTPEEFPRFITNPSFDSLNPHAKEFVPDSIIEEESLYRDQYSPFNYSSNSSTCCTSSQSIQSTWYPNPSSYSSSSITSCQEGTSEEISDESLCSNPNIFLTQSVSNHQNPPCSIPTTTTSSSSSHSLSSISSIKREQRTRKIESFDREMGLDKFIGRGKKDSENEKVLIDGFISNGFFGAFANFHFSFQKETNFYNAKEKLLKLPASFLGFTPKARIRPLIIEYQKGEFFLNSHSISAKEISKLKGEDLLEVAQSSLLLLNTTFNKWILHVPVKHLSLWQKDLNAWELLTVKIFEKARKIESFRESMINVIGAHWENQWKGKDEFNQREILMTIYTKKIIRLQEIHNFIKNEEISYEEIISESPLTEMGTFPSISESRMEFENQKLPLLERITLLQTKLLFLISEISEIDDDRDERMERTRRVMRSTRKSSLSIQERMEEFIIRSMRLLKTYWQYDSFKSSFGPVSLISLFQNPLVKSRISKVLFDDLEDINFSKYHKVKLILHQALEMGNENVALKIISRFGFGIFKKNIFKKVLLMARKWNKKKQMDRDNYEFIIKLHDLTLDSMDDKLIMECSMELKKLLIRFSQKTLPLNGNNQKMIILKRSSEKSGKRPIKSSFQIQ